MAKGDAKSSLLVRALAEVLGTFILVTAVVDSIQGGKGVDPLCAGAALMIGVYCVGDVSGGHLNPAVSFGVFLTGLLGHTEFTILEFLVYSLAQFIGATSAAFKATYIWHTPTGGASSNVMGYTGALAGNITQPMAGHILATNVTNVSATAGGVWSCGLAEFLYTAVLVFVVLNVATCGDEGKGVKNSYFGLAIGFVLAASVSAIGSISMSCINPAVTFAIACLDAAVGGLPVYGYSKAWPFEQFLWYALVQTLGAVLAVALFAICRKHMIGGAKGTPDMLSKLVSEFFGTFVLCLTVMLVCHAPPSNNAALGIASSLMVMIYALGAVSGANFNPAVSLGILVVKMIKGTQEFVAALVEFLLYFVAQIVGSLIALLMSAMILREFKTTLVGKDMNALQIANGTMRPAAKGTWMAIFTAEAIFTFILVFTVLNVAVRQAPNQFYGIAIGFVIVAGAFSLGGISGGCFNPAVAIMIDFSGALNPNKYAHYRWGWSMVYMLFELFAAIMAALFYLCTSAGKEPASGDADAKDTYQDLEEQELQTDEDMEDLETDDEAEE